MNSSFFSAGLRVGENGLLGGTIADFVVVSFWACRVGAGLGLNLKLLVVVGLLNELVVCLLVDLVVVLEDSADSHHIHMYIRNLHLGTLGYLDSNPALP